VHAGEACGANSIFEALTDCHADRIGHGFHLFDESRVDVRQPLRQQQHAATIIKRATVARGNDDKACNSGTPPGSASAFMSSTHTCCPADLVLSDVAGASPSLLQM
jgi:hypothetical protein